jgi:hypothetical protein
MATTALSSTGQWKHFLDYAATHPDAIGIYYSMHPRARGVI